MKLFIADTPGTMARQVADILVDCMQSARLPLFCPASGDTPAALYQDLHRRSLEGRIDVSDWYFVGLDEWVGMNGQDEGSCRNSLDRLLFHPLGIRNEKICFFNGKGRDLRAECLRTENFIADRGVIDAVVLGIGMNGHVAMNEPGVASAARSHVTIIHPTTAATGQKYFATFRPLTRGLTLGMGNLLEARHVFLMATGRHKAAIVQKFLEGPVSADLPATLLRNHAGLQVFLDADAAALLTTK